MGLFRTVFEINGDSIENRKIFPPRVFCAPLTGFAYELAIGARSQKTTMMGLPRGHKSFKIGSTV